MSTNFDYVRVCEASGEQSAIHLGKSSGGARFLFRAHPALGITSFKALQAFFKKDPGYVVDEYNRPVPVEDFLDMAVNKQSSRASRPQ